MPLYEYICNKCGHEFETLRKFSDPPLKHCPQCKGPVQKKITAVGFQLRGAGWYKDGYTKSSGEKAPAPPSTEGKPAETKSEVKPAPKPEKNEKK